MIPKVGGIVTLKTIREIENSKKTHTPKKTKVIMISALNDDDSIEEARSYGCEYYIWKPIEIDNLNNILQEMKLIQ